MRALTRAMRIGAAYALPTDPAGGRPAGAGVRQRASQLLPATVLRFPIEIPHTTTGYQTGRWEVSRLLTDASWHSVTDRVRQPEIDQVPLPRSPEGVNSRA